MTQRPPTHEMAYLEAFESLQRNGYARDPSWVHTLRDTAISTFNDLGFPMVRRGNEEWKYTDIRPIARIPFRLPARPGARKAAGCGAGAAHLRRVGVGAAGLRRRDLRP